MNSYDRTKQQIEEMSEDIKSQYGTPELETVDLRPKKCEHYFIRKESTVFGCKYCTNHWIDNGEFLFEDGNFVEYKIPHVNAPSV